MPLLGVMVYNWCIVLLYWLMVYWCISVQLVCNWYIVIIVYWSLQLWYCCINVMAYVQDRDVKATVFRVGGSVPANNYILLPKSSSQSLGLTGSFFYLLFRPLPAKYFVVHLEVVTPAAMVIRISFSNLFREFKSTSTWLQFPYRHNGDCSEEEGVMGGARGASSRDIARWTFLCLDLRDILSRYLSCSFSYVKNIKLCANILVKNSFTSDIEYSPLEVPGATKVGGGTYRQPVPRDMSLALPKGAEFHEVYNYVRFPCDERSRRRSPGKSSRHNQQPKLLRGVKPGTVLISVTESGSGLSSNRPKDAGHRENGQTFKRDDLQSPRKSPGTVSQLKTVDGGGVEYYVEREEDKKVTERGALEGCSIESRAQYGLRLAQHKEAGGSGHSTTGVSRERVQPRVSWCVARRSEGEGKEDTEPMGGEKKVEGGGEGGRSGGRVGHVGGVRGDGRGLSAEDKRVHIHMKDVSKVVVREDGGTSSSSRKANVS